MPRKRDPNTTLRLTMLGPGRKWHSAKVSLNSSAVIQRCWSTMRAAPRPARRRSRRATFWRRRRNSSSRPGGVGAESGRDIRRRHGGRRRIRGHGRDLERRPRPRPSAVHSGVLPSLKLAAYIQGAGKPAMAINGRRNKPFGPGGSTRRLHQSPPSSGGFRRGRNRIDEGVKVVLLPGMVPPLSGQCNSCQRQLCSGCSGCVSGLKNQSEALTG